MGGNLETEIGSPERKTTNLETDQDLVPENVRRKTNPGIDPGPKKRRKRRIKIEVAQETGQGKNTIKSTRGPLEVSRETGKGPDRKAETVKTNIGRKAETTSPENLRDSRNRESIIEGL